MSRKYKLFKLLNHGWSLHPSLWSYSVIFSTVHKSSELLVAGLVFRRQKQFLLWPSPSMLDLKELCHFCINTKILAVVESPTINIVTKSYWVLLLFLKINK